MWRDTSWPNLSVPEAASLGRIAIRIPLPGRPPFADGSVTRRGTQPSPAGSLLHMSARVEPVARGAAIDSLLEIPR